MGPCGEKIMPSQRSNGTAVAGSSATSRAPWHDSQRRPNSSAPARSRSLNRRRPRTAWLGSKVSSMRKLISARRRYGADMVGGSPSTAASHGTSPAASANHGSRPFQRLATRNSAWTICAMLRSSARVKCGRLLNRPRSGFVDACTVPRPVKCTRPSPYASK